MTKPSKNNDHDQQQQQQQNLDLENPESSRVATRSCSSLLSSLFGLQCVIFMVLSFAVLISAIFWLFPRRSPSEFKADDITKLNGSVQASFRLKKPASEVVSRKGKLEHDICQSIGLLNTKVTILSLHQSGVPNYTDVEFAVLPVPPDYTISKDSLSSLRSSFIKLFVKRSKLKLTTSRLGKTTSFQVLKFPGGISVDPFRPNPVSGVLVILFGFTLDLSISQIQYILALLKGQLEHMLCLKPFEGFLHLLLTNEQGSTTSPHATVQVYVGSTMRNHLQQRLDHFAQIIQASRAKNLGLDSAVFGVVKSITFSTYLNGQILDSDLELAPTPTSCFPSLC